MCRKAMVVRIKFRIANEVTAGLILELNSIVGILLLILVEMDAVAGRSHG